MMMKKLYRVGLLLLSCLYLSTVLANDDEIAGSLIRNDTDGLYRELIRTVVEVDFTAMAATYHEDAVLVTNKNITPIGQVLQRWKKDGEAFQEAGGSATLDFRVIKRLINNGVASELGIFRYATKDESGKENVLYSYFEDLNIKKPDVG